MREKSTAKDLRMVTATEVASYVYCPEAWRIGHGLGLPSENQNELAAGVSHHDAMAAVEVQSTVVLRFALSLILLSGIILGVLFFGG